MNKDTFFNILHPILFALCSFLAGATMDAGMDFLMWVWLFCTFGWGVVTIADYYER